MRRWIALGMAGLGVAWGPYVYSELTRQPIAARHATQVSPLMAANFAAPLPHAVPSVVLRSVSLPLAAAAKRAPKPEPAASAPSAQRVMPASPDPPEDNTEARAEPEQQGAERDLAPAFRKAFDAEPRDAFWASDEEPRLASLLQGAGLPDGAIAEVACRKSVCRVAFNKFELDSDAETKLSAKIAEGFARGAAFDPRNPDSEVHAPLFVLRPGYKLEP